ncbi:hypothetical protein [Desulfocurvus sp. DL9XJH121]
MDGVVIILLSMGMGLVTVEMFGKAWLGFLGLLAPLILRLKGIISTRRMAGRLHRSLARMLLCCGVLALAFFAYTRHLGLGYEEHHVMAYFVAAVVRLVVFMRSLPQEIDYLFRPGRPR